MTRINAGINPKLLSDKHLLAEHREIKRIPNMVKSGRANLNDIPEQFTLGKGHVKFFYNKLHYLYKRYNLIYNECRRRGFMVESYHAAWDFKELKWYKVTDKGAINPYFGDWDETPEARQLIQARINDRLNGIK